MFVDAHLSAVRRSHLVLILYLASQVTALLGALSFLMLWSSTN
jgi:hypothetical protein